MQEPLSRREFAVFPLFAVKDGVCACSAGVECTAAGKHPAYAFSALAKGEKVHGRPGCGYGIATGERSGVFVVDFDTFDALHDIESDPTRPLPCTLTVRTGRGVHLYYKWPGFKVRNSASELAPKVDIRGDGGFVVAPGSPHKNGGTYSEVEPFDLPIADAPAWLLEWPGLQAKERTPGLAGDNAPIPVDVDTDEGRERVNLGREWLAKEPACMAGAGGSGQLWRVALYLVRDLCLPLDVCRNLLDDYNERCGPEWSDAELWHKLENARDNSDRMPGGIDMAGFVAMAEATVAAERVEAIEARTVPVSKAAPHEYTFFPGTTVRQLQFYETADGERKVKKPAKYEVDEILFDLNSETDWIGVFRYNEFDDKIYAFRPPCRLECEGGAPSLTNPDIVALTSWYLDKKLATVRVEDLLRAVETAAKQHRFHSVRDWLAALPPATTRHLATLAATLFGDERPIAQLYVSKALVAACARAFEPGCKVDTVPTLVGPRALKKSTSIEELFRIPGADVFRTDLPDLKDFQKVGQALEGCWIAELAELSCTRKAEVETVKATLTRKVEKYSPKYVRGEVSRPRSCTFWASTNDMEGFLPRADPAFQRRFQPIHMTLRTDIVWLDAHHDEIWSEAMDLYRIYAALTTKEQRIASEAWWFNDEDVADLGRADFIAEDSWEHLTRTSIDALETSDVPAFFTAAEVYYMICGADAHAPTNADIKKVSEVMAALPYPKHRTMKARGWLIPVRK